MESILGVDKWNYIFAMRDDLYTYEGFLRAVAKFPAFCDESNRSDLTLDEACRYELATLFAHFGQETGNHNPNDPVIEEWRQGLVHVTEWACTEPQSGAGTSTCDYKENWGVGASYPPQSGVQYYGRGPFQLSWNYNYGAFSEVISPDSGYRSFMYLLEDPDLVHTDAFTVFASALWFYMTPQSPKPSIHDVATGYMEPTSADISVGIAGGFGTTTNIINGGYECGQGGSETAESENRIEYYLDFLDYFELPADYEASMGCAGEGSFAVDGFGHVAAYFDEDWSGAIKCRPVTWQTAYSIYTRDDYKRCVCDTKANGEVDCKDADGSEH